MINTEKTRILLGIETQKLRPNSAKSVFWCCDTCGAEKLKRFQSANLNTRCLNCSNKVNANSNKERRSYLMKQFWKDNLHPRIGKVAKSPKKIQYNGVWLRNSWEEKVAKYLDSEGKHWQYESDTFSVSYVIDGIEKWGTYTPDFRVGDTFLEVKGRKFSVGMAKAQAFIEQYSQYRLEIWDRRKLKQLEIL